MKVLKYYFDKSHKRFKRPLKIFSLLIISIVVVHISFWILSVASGSFDWELFKFTKEKNYSLMFELSYDGGYFEHFQYILLLWCSILSAIWIISKRYWAAIAIPIIYFYLCIDDVFLLHDQVGSNFLLRFFESKNLFKYDYIRIKDFAEWGYWLLIGGFVLVISKPCFTNSEQMISIDTKPI